jgi:hypothetical protein
MSDVRDMFPIAPKKVPMKRGSFVMYFDGKDGFIGVLNGKSEMREQPAYSNLADKYSRFYSYDIVLGEGSFGAGGDTCTSNSDVARYSWCMFHGDGTIATRLIHNKSFFYEEAKEVTIARERKLLVKWIFTQKKGK